MEENKKKKEKENELTKTQDLIKEESERPPPTPPIREKSKISADYDNEIIDAERRKLNSRSKKTEISTTSTLVEPSKWEKYAMDTDPGEASNFTTPAKLMSDEGKRTIFMILILLAFLTFKL